VQSIAAEYVVEPVSQQPSIQRRSRSPLLALALAALLGLPVGVAAPIAAARLLPVPPAGMDTQNDAARPTPDASRPPGEPDADPGAPSIHYEQAMQHEADDLEFEPGARVDVPFKPKADDDWEVDGRPPGALPPGHATGLQMRAAPEDATWAAGPPADLAAPDSAAPSIAAPDTPSPDDDTTATVEPASFTDTSAGDAVTAAPVGPGGLRREVFGFLPYWELTDPSTTLDWRTLSTVAYFSVGCLPSGYLDKFDPDGSTTTGWGGWTSSRMTSVINAAHRNHTRVVLTISCFAWTSSAASRQASLLGSATARARFAKAAAAAVRDRGADGINLDFEPIVAGYADEFTSLVRLVRTELNRIASGYQLTFDTLGSIGNQPIVAATAPGGADAVFIMGYDYKTDSSSIAGSVSPLAGPRYDLNDTIKAYTAKISPSKVILGVPYYGRAWSTSSDQVNASTLAGAKYGYPASPTYSQASDLVATYGRRYDSVEQAPWTAYRKQTCTSAYGCVTSWRELYYDDAASLRLRYDLVNRASLRGAGIWALGYDDAHPELRSALADKFLPPRTAVLGVNGPITPNRSRTLNWHFKFGGPVKWLRANDFVRTGTATGCIIGAPHGSGASWTVAVSGCGNGTVKLALKAGSVADAAGNWGPTSATNTATILIDRSAPASATPSVALRTGVGLASTATTTGLLASVTLAATDPGGAGIRSYDVRRGVDGATDQSIATGVTSATLATFLAQGHTYRFSVRARDRAGNVGGWVIGPLIRGYLAQQSSAALAWTGAWSKGASASYSGRADRFSMGAGASVTYQFTGRAVAWVTTLGPDRGAARVYVDGVLAGTVDTHAARLGFRRIAFARSWSSSGLHTLRIVVAGSAGRARVDVDAVEVVR